MIDNFAGKTALLTGAGSGFGLECARIAAARGMRLVLVDVQQDALNAAAAELRAAGAEVLGIASIFTYGMQKGLDRLAAAGVKNVSLSSLDVLVEVAAETGYIKPAHKDALLRFRDNPADAGWMAALAE